MLGILVQGYCVFKARNHKSTMSVTGKGNMVTFALTIIHSAGIFVMHLVRVRVIESPECVDKVQGVWGLKSSCADTNGVRVRSGQKSITSITSAPILLRNTCLVKFIRFLDLSIFLNIAQFHFFYN